MCSFTACSQSAHPIGSPRAAFSYLSRQGFCIALHPYLPPNLPTDQSLWYHLPKCPLLVADAYHDPRPWGQSPGGENLLDQILQIAQVILMNIGNDW